MKLKIIQTADATSRYKELLDVTRHVNEQYCKRHGYAYEAFVGIKRGVHPWHACFNRIYMFLDEIERQEYDWILYMDADCFVHNVDIRAADIAGETGNSKIGMLMCGGGGPQSNRMCDINSGVIFLNVRSRYAKGVTIMWREIFESLFTEEVMRTSVVPFGLSGGPMNVIFADQAMLSYVLQVYGVFGMLEYRAVRTYVGDEYTKFNYDGDFIRQLLRPDCGVNGTQIDARIEAARVQVAQVIARFGMTPLPGDNRLVVGPGFIGF